MKILHLSDLHIGLALHGHSLFEDQKYIFNQIIEQIYIIKPQTIILAGDIYEKTTPSNDAVSFFDWFLDELTNIIVNDKQLNILIIGGNHDSDQRLSCGSNLMKKNHVYISKPFNNQITPIILNDEFGEINFYLLPFIKPIHVRPYYPDEEILDYDKAMLNVIQNMNIDKTKRNIIVSHQYITGASICDSEELIIGGSENISAEVYKDFDYVALGHIHSPQDIQNKYTNIRYCGTPLKYSISEIGHTKSLTFLDVNEKIDSKTNITFNLIDLIPLRDLKCIKGLFEDINKETSQDYVHITLTDKVPVIDAKNQLIKNYPFLLQVQDESSLTNLTNDISTNQKTAEMSPLDIFIDFYSKISNKNLSDENDEDLNEENSSQNNLNEENLSPETLNDAQLEILKDLINEIWKV